MLGRGAVHGRVVRAGLVKRRPVAGHAPSRDFPGAGVFAEALDLLELLGGDQPARDAFLGLIDEALAIIVVRCVRVPRGMMPLVLGPFDVATVHDCADLEFLPVRVLVPPAELDAHGDSKTDGGGNPQGGTVGIDFSGGNGGNGEEKQTSEFLTTD